MKSFFETGCCQMNFPVRLITLTSKEQLLDIYWTPVASPRIFICVPSDSTDIVIFRFCETGVPLPAILD